MGTVAIVCTWAAFHALIATSVILAVLRDRPHPRTREFFLSLPMLAGTRRDAQVHCRTVSLQSDRASFDAPAGLRGASLLHVTLYLSGRRFDLEAAIIDESVEARGVVRVNVRLLWPEVGDARDTYLRLLHSCTWHRALAWPGTHIPTVLEKLLDITGFALRPKQLPRWRAVLYSEALTTKARLGLLRHARHHGEDVIELLAFEEVHGEHFTVLDPAPGESAPARHFLRFAGAWQAHPWPGASVTAWREAGVLRAVVIPPGAEGKLEAEPNAAQLRRKQ